MLTREKVIKSIQDLPDSFTIDDLIDRLIFVEKVEQGLKQSAEGKVVPHEELMPATLELAAKIAGKPPLAVRLTKEGIRRSMNIPVEQWKEWYSFAQRYCFGTEDHQEGTRAFIEKREPDFQGR